MKDFTAYSSNNHDSQDKRLKGQFFTTINPFVNDPFVKWLEAINEKYEKAPKIIEPFAGANNIIWMVRELGFKNPWGSYDIDPSQDNSVEEIAISKRDTLSDFPEGYDVAITNPPYLAKNSATLRGLQYDGGPFEDLYQRSLSVMLENCDYVAVIIPETFIKQELFTDRIQTVVSLTCRMFDDTNHPVCLALFCPSDEVSPDDFEIWQNSRFIGTYKGLKEHLVDVDVKYSWVFNDPTGLIALKGADGNKTADIAFLPGDAIPAAKVKSTSRHNTRISLEGLKPAEVPRLLQIANRLLEERRAATKDVFMTAHRGLRADGKYRRRLEYSHARSILNCALKTLREE